MSEATTRLMLSYLQPAQAQKHVTVNEDLRILDALVQLSVASATLATQPASPADGDCYILPAGKTGAAWGAMADGAIAHYVDGAWASYSPREGFIVAVQDTDVVVVHSGAAWVNLATWLAAGSVTYAKLQNVTGTDKVLGRSSTGAGVVEELVCTAAGRALIDDADASAQRTTLGLGTAATQNTGTSGANVPLMNAANTWAAKQIFGSSIEVSSADPEITLYETDGPADAKYWGFYALSGGLRFLTKNDARASYKEWFAVSRSGDTVTNASLGANLLPMADNAYNLGSGSFRFGTVFAATGTINTSDAREKTALEPVPETVKRAVRRIIAGMGVFQWRQSVAQKGEFGARLHVGVTAQDVAAAFEAEGEDPARWALFCADRDGPDTRLGLRMDQLLLLSLGALAEA